jgi:hypothetical protein
MNNKKYQSKTDFLNSQLNSLSLAKIFSVHFQTENKKPSILNRAMSVNQKRSNQMPTNDDPNLECLNVSSSSSGGSRKTNVVRKISSSTPVLTDTTNPILSVVSNDLYEQLDSQQQQLKNDSTNQQTA